MRTTIIYIFLIFPMLLWGQEERKFIREGYKAYMDEDYNEAEIGFRKAEDARSDSYIARYNTSTALYQQENMEESGKRFSELMAEAPNDAEQAKLLHNLGNVMLKGKKYQEAADAYKKSLRLNPKDEDTRYNLAYALEKLREQQQQQQQQNKDQDKDQNKDKEKNDKDQDQQQKDQNKDQEQQEQDQEQKDDQQQKSQEQEENKDQQQKEQQAQKQELNKEEAERLLNAILQKEKDVKEKVDKKKATATKIKTDKDW